jgi:hypothetical protein
MGGEEPLILRIFSKHAVAELQDGLPQAKQPEVMQPSFPSFPSVQTPQIRPIRQIRGSSLRGKP